MRIETLLSPGAISQGLQLRTVAAKAISSIEIVAGRTPGGKTSSAAQLAAFFTDCASKVSPLGDATAPTVTTRVRTAANTATVTFNETLDTTVVPPTSAFVFTPARTVTNVAVVGSTVVVTATGTIVGDTIAYTKPATNGLRDRAGNQVANFSGVLA